MSNLFKKYLYLFCSMCLTAYLFNGCAKRWEDIVPPKAEKIKKELTIHDDVRVDNYFWLRERENSKVLDYLKAENTYTKNVLKPVSTFRTTLFDEIVARIKKDDNTVPYKSNAYYYYTRYEEGKEYPIYARKKENLEANEEILLDVNDMAVGYGYYRVAGLNISENNRYLAFGVDTVSRRKYSIYIKDLQTNEVFDENIKITSGYSIWANDNKTLFYTTKDSTLRNHKIFRHEFGNDAANDKEIYHEADNTFRIGLEKSKSKKYIFINSNSTLSTEYRYISADKPENEFKIFQPRETNLEYSLDHKDNNFYIVTNYKAKNFRLMKASSKRTLKYYWKEVIPHRDDVLLEDVELFNDYLVIYERKDGLTQLRVINQKNKTDYYLDFKEEAFKVQPTKNYELNTNLLRFNYTSLTTPSSIYDFNMITKEKTLLKQDEVVGDFNSENYITERHYAIAEDSTKVPISLVYKKGLKKDGTNPLLLYGYGSYGYSIDPTFRSSRLSLIDRGFVFVMAHIRGGQEMGRQWYEDGKLLKKKNTFTDFITCAEYLIEQNFTNTEKLFAMGGSAGGLLIGAVANMRPDLFKGVIAAVPWVDVVTTMLDESIPLTTSEYDEWGNPNDKVYYDYMLSYSPYDNVEAKNYPAMLITTGLHDSQVQYWEPAKWTAKLRELKTDDNMLLLHTQMQAGHGGKSGRFERYKETAMEYAFMLFQMGVTK